MDPSGVCLVGAVACLPMRFYLVYMDVGGCYVAYPFLKALLPEGVPPFPVVGALGLGPDPSLPHGSRVRDYVDLRFRVTPFFG